MLWNYVFKTIFFKLFIIIAIINNNVFFSIFRVHKYYAIYFFKMIFHFLKSGVTKSLDFWLCPFWGRWPQDYMTYLNFLSMLPGENQKIFSKFEIFENLCCFFFRFAQKHRNFTFLRQKIDDFADKRHIHSQIRAAINRNLNFPDFCPFNISLLFDEKIITISHKICSPTKFFIWAVTSRAEKFS